MLSLNRPTIIAAGLGGGLWTAKAIGITINDGSIDPLESVLFIGGLLALVAAMVLAALHLTRRLKPLARVPAAIGAAVALFAVTILLEAVGNATIGGVATGDNLGLEEEGGILLCGLAWLALAVTAARSGERRHAVPAVAA